MKLADLKRDIRAGVVIELVNIQEAIKDATPLHDAGIRENMSGPRTVSKVDTTGFYLLKPGQTGRGNFCNWPYASALVYEGGIFTITEQDQDGFIWQVRTYKIIS